MWQVLSYLVNKVFVTCTYLMLKFVDELPLDDASGFSGWGRLDVYARRVRTLYMEPLHIRIPPNIYFRIRAFPPSS